MSVEMPSGVLIADMMEGMQFALGPVMALRRDVLENIGGIASTAEYYSDDFVLGNRVHAAGYRVILSHYRVGHVLCTQSLAKTFATQIRWMQSTRYSRPKGHLGTGLTFAVPFGLLAFVAATALGHPALGAALLAWSLLNRITQSIAIGYGTIGDRRALRHCWLYPLRDLLGFFSGSAAIAEAATSAGAANSTASPRAAKSSPSSAPSSRNQIERVVGFVYQNVRRMPHVHPPLANVGAQVPQSDTWVCLILVLRCHLVVEEREWPILSFPTPLSTVRPSDEISLRATQSYRRQSWRTRPPLPPHRAPESATNPASSVGH